MTILLTVAVAAQLCTLTQADLDALPQKTILTSTTWHTERMEFTGPLLADVLHSCKKRIRPRHLKVSALNDYSVLIPYADLPRWRPILASRINGKPFPVSKKGPLWVMYPVDQHKELQNLDTDTKLIWQVSKLEAVYK